MVKGLLADVNDVKQVRVLVMLMQEEPRAELWRHLALATPTLADVNLTQHSCDRCGGLVDLPGGRTDPHHSEP